MSDEPPKRKTRRQALRAMLADRTWSFEALRSELRIPIHLLEDDLQHLERSLRRSEDRLEVSPARCRQCDFRFTRRAPGRFHKPGRCPRCRGESITGPDLRVGSAS